MARQYHSTRGGGEEEYLMTDNRTKRMSEKHSLSSVGVNNWFLDKNKNKKKKLYQCDESRVMRHY